MTWSQSFKLPPRREEMLNLEPKYYRRVIRITAEDSPNVQRALKMKALGLEPDNLMVLEGVLTWEAYLERRAMWDAEEQCVGLDAQFYRGPEQLLFPPAWLQMATQRARQLSFERKAIAIGIDPAEGGDKTTMVSVDMLGIIKLKSRKTPDTSDITGEAKAFAIESGINQDEAWRICFDQGGGGKEHADRMIREGWKVRTIAFGAAVNLDPKYGRRLVPEMKELRADRYVYLNRRAEMYGEAHLLMDPSLNPQLFGIPEEYKNLLFELGKMPKKYDGEGRFYMLPKHSRDSNSSKREKTLTELIGHSPDDADALVLAIHNMLSKPPLVIGSVL